MSREAERGGLAQLESNQGCFLLLGGHREDDTRTLPEAWTQQQHGHFDEMQEKKSSSDHEVSPKLEQMFLTGCVISIPGGVQSSLTPAGSQQAAVPSQVSRSVSADSRAVQMERDHQRGCAPGLCRDL